MSRHPLKSSKTRAHRRNHRQRQLSLEPLEPRCLLASDFVYDPGAAPSPLNVILSSEQGQLKLKDYDDNSVIQSMALADVANIVLKGTPLDDFIRLGDLSGLSGNLTVDGGNGYDHAIVSGDVNLVSGSTKGNVEITSEVIIVLQNASLVAGDISLLSKGADAGLSVASNLPIDIGDSLAGERTIIVSSGAVIEGKKVVLASSRIASLVSPVRPFGGGNKNTKIDISGATIKGDSVSITADSKDENLTDAIPQWAQNYFVGPALSFIFDGVFPTIPFAVMVRGSESQILINNATITSEGDVNIVSTSVTDATTSAMGIRDSEKDIKEGNLAEKGYGGLNKMAIGYSQATSKAVTDIQGTTSITAKGDVNIKSDTKTTAKITSTVRLNFNASSSEGKVYKDSPSNPNAMGFSIAVSNSSTTSNSLLGDQVVVTSDKNVAVEALGDVSNSAKAGINIYVDGRRRWPGVGVDQANVKAKVDGKITAKGSKTAKDLVLGNIDPVTDIITMPGHGLKTGDEILYQPVDPNDTKDPKQELTPIGGLLAGERVNVVVVDKDHIKLVRANGLQLDASTTSPTSKHSLAKRDVVEFNPVDAVNPAANTITVNTLEIEEGEELNYAAGS